MLNIYSEIFEFDDHEKTSVNMGENHENERRGIKTWQR